jgi:hypothetical protein
MLVQELEALSERDFITDEQYGTIMSALPSEASLHNTVLPIPGRSSAAASSTSPTPLSDNFAAMSVNDQNPSTAATSVTSNTSPPSYNQTPAPLPPRNPPRHNEIAHVVALYRYSDPDPRDLNFEPGDHISVTEYCNPDWWQGKNVRSGEEGIFPKNYVRVENTSSPLAQQYSNEKAPGYMYGGPPPQQPMGGYYPNQPPQQAPPGPSSPYDGPVPPMAIAEQPASHAPSRGAEMGKKFGRKLGNAAIFGAGATLGADVVNSIF